jgi:hypothetical protein
VRTVAVVQVIPLTGCWVRLRSMTWIMARGIIASPVSAQDWWCPNLPPNRSRFPGDYRPDDFKLGHHLRRPIARTAPTARDWVLI